MDVYLDGSTQMSKPFISSTSIQTDSRQHELIASTGTIAKGGWVRVFTRAALTYGLMLISGGAFGAYLYRSMRPKDLTPMTCEILGLPSAMLQNESHSFEIRVTNRLKEPIELTGIHVTCSCTKPDMRTVGKSIPSGDCVLISCGIDSGLAKKSIGSIVYIKAKTESRRELVGVAQIDLAVSPIVSLSLESLDFGLLERGRAVETTVLVNSELRDFDVTDVDLDTSIEKAFRIVGVTKLDPRKSELRINCDTSQMPEECSSWYGTISFNTTITEIGMQSIPARVSILADMVVRPTTIVLSSDQPETNVILAFKGDSQRGIQPWSVNTGNTSVTVDPPEMVSEGVYVFKVKKVDGSSTKGDLKITHSTREQFSVRIPVSFFEGDQ